METSITYLKEQFQLKDPDIRSYSPLTLAYIGDGIYELYIRTILIKQGNCQVNKLHKQASRLVKAQAQSEMVQVLEPHLPRKKKQSTREVEMQSPTLQRRMPLQGIIAVRRDLRRLWGICI